MELRRGVVLVPVSTSAQLRARALIVPSAVKRGNSNIVSSAHEERGGGIWDNSRRPVRAFWFASALSLSEYAAGVSLPSRVMSDAIRPATCGVACEKWEGRRH